jgi:integrase
MSIMTSPQKHPTSGIYYFRQSVPKECRAAIGKTEFKNSLGTKNLSEAKMKIVQFMQEADQLVALARLKLNEANSPQVNDNSRKLTNRDCHGIANRWYSRTRAELQASDNYSEFLSYDMDADGNEYAFGLSDTLCLDGSVILTPNVNRIEGGKYPPKASEEELRQLSLELSVFIDSQLIIDGVSVSHSSQDYIVLAEAFYEHLIGLESLCLSRHKNDWNAEPKSLALAAEPLSVQVDLNGASGSGVNGETAITAIYEQYRESSIINDRDSLSTLRRLNTTRSQVARFVDIFGDMDIKSITKKDIAKFRDTLLQLPKDKSRSVRDWTIAEQVKYAEANQLVRITKTTVGNAVKQLSPVFTYALVELELIQVNPADKMNSKNIKKQMEADDTDRGYSSKELNTLFSLEIFSDNSQELTYGLACYWILLLCRYTGARLNEIAQLTRSDIECGEDGIHCIHVCRVDGKSVKNNPSVRRIPINEHLIELGFLEFVKHSKGALFPKVPKDTYGKQSTAISRWWRRALDTTAVVTKQPFHAFRHSFKTEMRTLGVADSVSDAITGHKPNNEGARYGSVTMATKKEAINKLSRLDVTRIY